MMEAAPGSQSSEDLEQIDSAAMAKRACLTAKAVEWLTPKNGGDRGIDAEVVSDAGEGNS